MNFDIDQIQERIVGAVRDEFQGRREHDEQALSHEPGHFVVALKLGVAISARVKRWGGGGTTDHYPTFNPVHDVAIAVAGAMAVARSEHCDRSQAHMSDVDGEHLQKACLDAARLGRDVRLTIERGVALADKILADDWDLVLKIRRHLEQHGSITVTQAKSLYGRPFPRAYEPTRVDEGSYRPAYRRAGLSGGVMYKLVQAQRGQA